MINLHEIEIGKFYNRDDIFSSSDYFTENSIIVIAIAGNTIKTVGIFSKLKNDKLICLEVIID